MQLAAAAATAHKNPETTGGGLMKGSKPARSIKNEVAVYLDGENVYLCDSDDVSSAREVTFDELKTIFAKRGLEILFWRAESALKFLMSKGVPIPENFHCIHSEIALWTDRRTQHAGLDAAFHLCFSDEPKPTNSHQRAWALWWLHSDELSEVPNAEATYLLKLGEIRKKLTMPVTAN